jgi:hypothetical protein
MQRVESVKLSACDGREGGMLRLEHTGKTWLNFQVWRRGSRALGSGLCSGKKLATASDAYNQASH